MIGALIRSIAAVIAGLVLAMVLIIAVEVFSSIFHPFPPDVDPADLEVCRAHVAKYPTWVLAVGAVGWALTTFVSSWLATRLGTNRHPAHGIVVGSILLLAAVANMLMLPYALWFKVFVLVTFPLGIYYGAKLGRGQPSNAQGAVA